MSAATGGGTADAPISASIGSATSSQIAVGTDIRQQAIYLTVSLTSGDPAALERVARQVRFQPRPAPVDATGVDFPNLLGRDAEIDAARRALAGPPPKRRSVAVFGVDGIGKTVLLRHLAPRASAGFTRGVAHVDTGANRWQDVAQEVVQSFYEAEIVTYLGTAQLRRLLDPLDALVVLDDVAANADIGQLFGMLKHGSVVVASTERLLAGDTRGIRLNGLTDEACVALIQATLDDLGLTFAVDPEVGTRIGRALGGHPSRIIEKVIDADGRHVTLAQLADELEAGGSAPAPSAALTPDEQQVIATVASLGGAPVGPEHIAAVAGVAADVVNDLARRMALRAASPQLRLSVDRAAAAGSPAANLDVVRERFLAHFVRWAYARRDDPAAIGEESRAIQALLRWASRTGRHAEVLALAEAVDTGLAAGARWGAWSEATQYRLRAAEALQDGKQEAIAINQMGVQALADDDATGARDLFAKARDRADVFGASAISQVAERNRRIVDALLGPPPPGNPWTIIASGALIVVVILAALFLLNRKAIAIEPASRVFDSAVVEADGEQVTFRVTNEGAVQLEALDVRLVGSDAFFVVGGDCPGATLAPASSCTVDVLFHPTKEGEVQATLRVTARDGTVVVASITSVGEPITPEPSVPPTPTPSPSPSPSETPEARQLPDIVIEEFAPTDVPRQGEGLFAIPVRLVVKNVGEGTAGLFPIVIYADGSRVAIQVPDETGQRLVTLKPLTPDETFTFEGSMYLPDETPLDTADVIVAADSCDADGATPDDCPVEDARPENNTYPLQSADIVVSGLTIGTPREPLPGGIFQPPYVLVDVSFDITNNGHEPTGDFWVASFLGQTRPTLTLDQLETDTQRGLPRVPSLEPDAPLQLTGTVMVPRTSVEFLMAIVAGCPPGAEPCWVPEIAFENNVATGSIPPQPTPTPADNEGGPP